jgi:hypothetical protein
LRLGWNRYIRLRTRRALQALLVHPLVGSYPLARSILDEYLAVHPDLLAKIASFRANRHDLAYPPMGWKVRWSDRCGRSESEPSRG